MCVNVSALREKSKIAKLAAHKKCASEEYWPLHFLYIHSLAVYPKLDSVHAAVIRLASSRERRDEVPVADHCHGARSLCANMCACVYVCSCLSVCQRRNCACANICVFLRANPLYSYLDRCSRRDGPGHNSQYAACTVYPADGKGVGYTST